MSRMSSICDPRDAGNRAKHASGLKISEVGPPVDKTSYPDGRGRSILSIG